MNDASEIGRWIHQTPYGEDALNVISHLICEDCNFDVRKDDATKSWVISSDHDRRMCKWCKVRK